VVLALVKNGASTTIEDADGNTPATIKADQCERALSKLYL
jgi:hypothetical protein